MYIFNGPHQKLIPNNCFAFFMKSDHRGGGGVQGRICICMTLRPKQATLKLINLPDLLSKHNGPE